MCNCKCWSPLFSHTTSNDTVLRSSISFFLVTFFSPLTRWDSPSEWGERAWNHIANLTLAKGWNGLGQIPKNKLQEYFKVFMNKDTLVCNEFPYKDWPFHIMTYCAGQANWLHLVPLWPNVIGLLLMREFWGEQLNEEGASGGKVTHSLGFFRAEKLSCCSSAVLLAGKKTGQ